MDLHTGLKGTVLTSCLALCGAGCAMSSTPASNNADGSGARTVAAHARDATPGTSTSADAFEGDWYYGSDCDFGHYVTLELKRADHGYTGDWSDGTRVRGSQGNLRGEIHNGELVVQRCDDGTDVGGEPDCPRFEEPHDLFARKGDSLVWSYVYDGRRTPYVTLHAAGKKVDTRAECKEDTDGEGEE